MQAPAVVGQRRESPPARNPPRAWSPVLRMPAAPGSARRPGVARPAGGWLTRPWTGCPQIGPD